ncbi:hypothetical protein RvY_05396 [Ramazzottius varieornatus]|uniref:Uncharacterized protein n=1 Tax=Ramazzottius varieornatus TaxID=947166 RepID=A0A1D1UUX1_RAMVA|nr:hypothetical protein RvY_05396 [Ramazzottius varieornatus]
MAANLVQVLGPSSCADKRASSAEPSMNNIAMIGREIHVKRYLNARKEITKFKRAFVYAKAIKSTAKAQQTSYYFLVLPNFRKPITTL